MHQAEDPRLRQRIPTLPRNNVALWFPRLRCLNTTEEVQKRHSSPYLLELRKAPQVENIWDSQCDPTPRRIGKGERWSNLTPVTHIAVAGGQAEDYDPILPGFSHGMIVSVGPCNGDKARITHLEQDEEPARSGQEKHLCQEDQFYRRRWEVCRRWFNEPEHRLKVFHCALARRLKAPQRWPEYFCAPSEA